MIVIDSKYRPFICRRACTLREVEYTNVRPVLQKIAVNMVALAIIGYMYAAREF